MEQQNKNIEQSKLDTKDQVKEHLGIPLVELLSREGTDFDPRILNFLKIILEQNPSLSHVELVSIRPEEEPDTGGSFDIKKINKNKFIPTIFIVSENIDHIKKIMKKRRSSAEITAKILGIPFHNLTPKLLKIFIVAHELGHAIDYIKNYELNPDYEENESAKEWNMHYEANLSLMPVKGLDPADLIQELSKSKSLEDFLTMHPDVKKAIDSDKIKTLEDLQNAQEVAYRSLPHENYADNFAANFLKKNAQKLEIYELP